MQPPRTKCRKTAVALAADKGLEVVGTVIYLGRLPVVSGTAGSIAGIVLFWLCRRHTVLLAGLTPALFVLGTLAARHLERKTGDPDPSCVVIDEMVGMMAALALLERSWITAIAAFLAFRFFDILKPFPARLIEEIRGGLGIMLDDIVAAAYACVVVRLALVLTSH